MNEKERIKQIAKITTKLIDNVEKIFSDLREQIMAKQIILGGATIISYVPFMAFKSVEEIYNELQEEQKQKWGGVLWLDYIPKKNY